MYEETLKLIDEYPLAMLAIACLIESRFKDAAILYGDFDKGQAEISVQWANNILDRPIDLPTLVNYDQLWGQLKTLMDKEEGLRAFYRLTHGHKALNVFIGNNFSRQDIFSLYKTEMKDYKTATQFGIIRMLIEILNMGYSLKDLSEICCFSQDGPQFDHGDFINALCSTWVFIPQEYISPMDIYETASGQAHTVDSQLFASYLEMNGFQGRKIDVHIP